MSYSVSDYAGMVGDGVRAPIYVEALRRLVKPGCVVVELGTGYGVFALIAAQLGARKVYAIEPNDAILAGQDLLAANPALVDRVEFLHGMSYEKDLPERADILLSDMRGGTPLVPGHFRALADARKRFLKPGGAICAQRDTLCCALVSSHNTYDAAVAPWKRLEADVGDLQINWNPIRDKLVNDVHRAEFSTENVLLGPAPWATVDFTTVEASDVSGTVSWTCETEGRACGVAVWFDAQVLDDLTFSNAPGNPPTVYGRTLLPLPNPVDLNVGDTVAVTIRAQEVNGQYLWRWDVRVESADGLVRLDANQSSFLATPISIEQLRRRAADYVPSLGSEGVIQLTVLQGLQAQTPLGEIARAVHAAHPDLFDDYEHALAKVGTLSVRFAKS